MKILSIDYDFFQKTTVETITKYSPDGIDLPTDLTELTWSDYYINPRSANKLNAVEINRPELDCCKQILLNQDTDIPVLIANSHRHIYDFIHEFCDENEEHALDHIDMHHDMFNENEKVDCGNWLNHILEEYGTDNMLARWIPNPISLEAFELTDSLKKSGLSDIPTSLDFIKDEIYDMIFICRSDTWTPPHLDIGFQELVDTVQNHFIRYKIEKCVQKPRNLEPILSQLRNAYGKMGIEYSRT